ncbi:MAG: hemolysin family protein [Reyranella sp.]|uniref:hemolysin family protein n=3 Tax=Reyranella sp. TaxID=1929291 RepID=UPI003D121AB5
MIYIELLVAIVLILINGLLAMSELAVVSARRGRLKALADRGSRGAASALALAENPGRFLSTVQIGITLVGILAGAFSGATLGARLTEGLVEAGVSRRFAEPVAYGSVVALITYLSLIVGELVPKQIALRNAEGVAATVAPAMALLARVAAPLVWLLDVSGKAVLGLLGRKEESETTVTADEIKALIAEAETSGALEPRARGMISGVMRLSARSVEALMTPRVDVDTIDVTLDPAVTLAVVRASSHAQLPAFEGDDNIIGIIHAKDLLDSYIAGNAPDVRALVRTAPIVIESMNALDALDMLKDSPVPMALVQDEYGHFVGVVTPSDVLEAIAGAFHTGEGPPEPDATQRADGSWLIAGSMPVDELAELLGFATARAGDYHTAAGLVLSAMRRLPEAGDAVDVGGWRLEVIDMDGRRIDKILATRMAPAHRIVKAAR